MSRQFMDDVELVTKQELEAALNACVVPEERVQEIVDQNSELHDANEAQIRADVQALRTLHEADKADLIDRIEDEADTRSRADAGLAEDINQEAEKRKQADTDLLQHITDMRTWETDQFPNVPNASRLKGLPLATITYHNTDKSLHVGDVVATVDERFYPKDAVNFWVDVEQLDGTGASITMWAHFRLNNHGDIVVVNLVPFAGATSGTDEYTATYLTEA